MRMRVRVKDVGMMMMLLVRFMILVVVLIVIVFLFLLIVVVVAERVAIWNHVMLGLLLLLRVLQVLLGHALCHAAAVAAHSATQQHFETVFALLCGQLLR